MFEKLGKTFAALWRRTPEDRFAAANAALERAWSEPAFATLRALAGEGYAPAEFRLGQLYETAEGVAMLAFGSADRHEMSVKEPADGQSLAAISQGRARPVRVDDGYVGRGETRFGQGVRHGRRVDAAVRARR